MDATLVEAGIKPGESKVRGRRRIGRCFASLLLGLLSLLVVVVAACDTALNSCD